MSEKNFGQVLLINEENYTNLIWTWYCKDEYRSVWSNYRPAGRIWPATAFAVARGIIQEKSWNLQFVEERV